MYLPQHGILGAVSRAADSIPVPNNFVSRTVSIFPFTRVGNDWQGRPNILQNKIGEWVCVWIEGVDHSDISPTTGRVNISFSNDEGVTWSANNKDISATNVTGFPLAAHLDAAATITDFQFFMCPNGDLIIIGHELKTASGTWNNTNVTQSQYRSTDNGKTWAFDLDFCDSIGFNTTALRAKIQGNYENLLIGSTIYLAMCAINTSIADSRIVMYKSADNAATWTSVSTITAYAERTYAWTEVALAYLGGNRIIAVASQNATNFNTCEYRISNDMGLTWGTVDEVSDALGYTGICVPRVMVLGSNLIIGGRDNKRFPEDITLSLHDRCAIWSTPINNLFSLTQTRRNYCDPYYSGASLVAIDQGDSGYLRFMRRADNSLYCLGYYGTHGTSDIYAYVLNHSATPSAEQYANNAFFPETITGNGVRLQMNRDNITVSPTAPTNGGLAVATRAHNSLYKTGGTFEFMWQAGATVNNEFLVGADNKGWMQFINGRFFSVSNPGNDFFKVSFSMAFWLKPADGQPAATQLVFWTNSSVTTTLGSCVIIFLEPDGRMRFRYGVGGTLVNALTNSPVFADGTVAAKHIAWTVASGGFMHVWIDGVDTTLDATFNGNMSTVTMASFNSSQPLNIGQRRTNTSTYDLPYVGLLREWLYQPGVWGAGNVANIMLN